MMRLKHLGGLGCAAVVAVWACASKPKPLPPPPPKPPTLGDGLKEDVAGLRRLPPEDATEPDAVAALLGPSGVGWLACGVTQVARAPYAPAGHTEPDAVVVLAVFDGPDAARCGLDSGGSVEDVALTGFAGVVGDVRKVATPVGPRVWLQALGGRRLLRVMVADSAEGQTLGRALVGANVGLLDGPGNAGVLLPLLPSSARVDGTAEVLPAGPLPGVPGLWAQARYACDVDHEVLCSVTLLPGERAAEEARGDFQAQATADHLTVTAFRLGDALVVGAQDPAVQRETLLLQRGALLSVVRGVHSRRACAGVVDSFARLVPPAPPSPDAGPPGTDAGSAVTPAGEDP
jgi:hypothetical protein